MLGSIFVAIASACVALGAYLISSAFLEVPIYMPANVGSHKFLIFSIGIFANLLGSIFWLLGRKFLESYLFAWSMYLGLLILFGTAISMFFEKENLNSSQFIAIGMLVVSLLLLKGKA